MRITTLVLTLAGLAGCTDTVTGPTSPEPLTGGYVFENPRPLDVNHLRAWHDVLGCVGPTHRLYKRIEWMAVDGITHPDNPEVRYRGAHAKRGERHVIYLAPEADAVTVRHELIHYAHPRLRHSARRPFNPADLDNDTFLVCETP